MKYRSDRLVRVIGPTDVSTGVALDAATVTAHVFDNRRATRLTASVAPGGTVLPVKNASVFAVGETVSIEQLNAPGYQVTTVLDRDTLAKTITVVDPLTDTAEVGSIVGLPLGTPVPLTLYGTPTPFAKDWGYEGVIDAAFPGLELGMPVRLDIYTVQGQVQTLDVVLDIVESGGE